MENISKFKIEAEQELFSILDYWMHYTIDESGGFVGKIDNNNNVDASAAKGSVLNARILWAFSAAYNQYQKKNILILQRELSNILINIFLIKNMVAFFGRLMQKAICSILKSRFMRLLFAYMV